MKVNEILKQLASTSKRTEKTEILLQHKDNEELKYFFLLALDSSLSYYIKMIPEYASSSKESPLTLMEAMDLLPKLYKRIYTGNKAKIFLSRILSRLNEEDRPVIEKIIKRDPDCGVKENTVNEIWENLIPIWPCHLAERSTEENLANIKYPAIIQEKADGMRTNPLSIDKETAEKYGFDLKPGINFRSRNGKDIQTHGMLDEEIERFTKEWGSENIVIDCESLVVDSQGKILERKTSNGVMNKAIRFTIPEIEAARIVLRIWNVIPAEEFFTGKGTIATIDTLKKIHNILTNGNYKKIKMVRTQIVHNQEEALDFYKLMLSKKKEGGVLKNFDAVFEDKRSKFQVKLKIKEKVDMRVIATYPHEKKPNWIGGLTIQSECGRITCNCGSGLKDSDRKKSPDYFLNRIVVVETNAVDDENNSLFLPIFKEIREDKSIADTYEQIKKILDGWLEKEITK